MSASVKQIDFIKSLFDQCQPMMEKVAEKDEAVTAQITQAVSEVQDNIVAALQGGDVDDPRKTIDVLLSVKKTLSQVYAASALPGLGYVDRVIVNKFAKPCNICGDEVEEGKGHAAQQMGKWNTYCAQCASETPEVRFQRLAARPAPVVAETSPKGTAARVGLAEGFYKVGDDIYKVQENQSGTGVYAKRLYVTDAHDAEFVYDGKGKVTIAKALADGTGHLLTLDEAKQFGSLYGICCICARTLNDEDSIKAGIGPVCATRF